jgi:stage V sporulation protein G
VEITEVRIKLMEDHQERLQAFCSLTFDHCFVIRDLKIIEGTKGSFVAMPSRKLTDRCPKCRTKNHLRASFCNTCGNHLPEDRAIKTEDGRAKLYADIAHPINSRCREHIQALVLVAYREETVRAQQPGYTCNYDDYSDFLDDALEEIMDLPAARPAAAAASGTFHRLDTPHPNVNAAHQDAATPSRPTQHAPVRSNGEDGFGAGIL